MSARLPNVHYVAGGFDGYATDGPGEFRCADCGNRCTRGPSGTEYGHRRYRAGRCPRRPEGVDPLQGHDGSATTFQ